MPLIFHWGGPRHRQVADVENDLVASGILVYDGPEWIGVYAPSEPRQVKVTDKGHAEVWLVRE